MTQFFRPALTTDYLSSLLHRMEFLVKKEYVVKSVVLKTGPLPPSNNIERKFHVNFNIVSFFSSFLFSIYVRNFCANFSRTNVVWLISLSYTNEVEGVNQCICFLLYNLRIKVRKVYDKILITDNTTHRPLTQKRTL